MLRKQTEAQTLESSSTILSTAATLWSPPAVTMSNSQSCTSKPIKSDKEEADKTEESSCCDCPNIPNLSIKPVGLFMLWLLTAPVSGEVNKPRFVTDSINWHTDYGLNGDDSTHIPSKYSKAQELCTRNFDTFNKPKGMELGGKDGKTVPMSCVTGSPDCAKDQKALDTFKHPRQMELNQSRQLSDQMEKQAASEIMPAAKVISQKLNASDQQIFNSLVKKLPKLIKIHSAITSSQNLDGGNCDEASAHDAYGLLQDKVKNGTDVKIQIITLGKNSGEKIREHVYLELDNPANDVIINNDPKAVQKELENVPGARCDRWNKQHFSSPGSAHSFYQADTGWTVMSRRTLDVNFSQLADLPAEPQKFICDQFSRIGLDLSGGICQSQKKAKSKKKNQ